MNVQRGLIIASVLGLAACANFEPIPEPKGKTKTIVKRPVSGPYTMDQDEPPLPDQIPPDIGNTPDAVPKPEPKSASGNSPRYTVLGGTYEVRSSAKDFRERGMASWYGRKFHGHKTASGERYDMFAMSAAHKTLPLPAYVRVTRVDTGKSIVVKVNDRGPFHGKRIIDLSYAAAAKLDMLKLGEVMVEIESITPDSAETQYARTPPAPAVQPAPVVTPPPAPTTTALRVQRGWLQVASYSDPVNALALREDLSKAGVEPVQVWSGGRDSSPVHRVLVGPFDDTVASDSARQKILDRGLAADWVYE